MVNLEKLLLAASRMLATTEENVQWSPPRQRRRKLSFAGDEKDNDHAASSRKLSLSQLPQKKDLAILKNDDGCKNREGGTGDNNNNNINEIVGSGLHKVDDQEKLSKLSEHDMMLDTCATEKTDKDLTKTSKKRTDKQREGSSHKVHAQRTKAERDEALAKLVKRRRDAARARRGSSHQSSVDKMDLNAANANDPNLTLSDEEESSRNEMEFSSDEDKKSPEPPTLHD